MPTKIEWATETWNPIRTADGGYHCTKVSEGCQNCYAERFNRRFGNGKPFDDTPTEFVLDEKQLEKPLHWKKPRRVFVQSMGDLFHEDIPHSIIQRVLYAIRMSKQHTFLVLTKRPERMRAFFMQYYVQGFIPNLWLGVTAENQARFDERVDILKQIPAAVHFVSIEPMLGPIVMRQKANDEREIIQATMMGVLDDYSRPVMHGIDWVICGGETGPGAQPMHPDWVRSIRDQCRDAGTPFFFKQWGDWVSPSQMPGETYRRIEDFGDGIGITDNPRKVGKKAAGRLLDGQEWRQYPECE